MARGFQAVQELEIPEIGEETSPPPGTPKPAAAPTANVAIGMATQFLLLMLKTISQKTIIALSTLFTAAGLFSAWWLWNSILPAPSVLQLIGLGMYAIFLLTLELVRRR